MLGQKHQRDQRREMAKRFKIGDHVRWNSEAGRVSGTIIDHIAAHKGGALDYA